MDKELKELQDDPRYEVVEAWVTGKPKFGISSKQAKSSGMSTVELGKALSAIADGEKLGQPTNVSTWMVGAMYRNFRGRLFKVTKVEQVSEVGWEISYRAHPLGTAVRRMDFAKWLRTMQIVGIGE